MSMFKIKSTIPYGRQEITQDDINAVVETLQSDFLTQGPKIKAFEDSFQKYIDSTYAIAVSNGTAALHLGCLALGIRPGDRVITSPITFAATANSILYCGGIVDFVDINKNTYTIDLDLLEKKLSTKPKGYFKGIIPVAFGGNPINTEKLKEICDNYGLWMLLDACHAPGASYIDSKGKSIKMGSNEYADATIFSFHPVKHIATGEGGMITCKNEDVYNQLIKLRTHGIIKEGLSYPFNDKDMQGSWYYEMQELGYNYRITDIQAALGVSQLKRAKNNLVKRQEIANTYQNAFDLVGIKYQKVKDNSMNAFHLFVIEVENRLGLYNFLRENDIYAQIHYIPVHLQPYYQKMGWKKGDFPVSENYYQHCISLPMFPTLNNMELEYIVNKIISFHNVSDN